MLRVEIGMPDDMHLHVRQLPMLEAVLPFTMGQFRRAIIMPNTQPPILDAQAAGVYRYQILDVAQRAGHENFEPLMTIQILEATTPETVRAAKAEGVVAGKVYPRGMTTNAENEVLHYENIYPALRAMEECGMRALFHGESPDPDVFCLDREAKFLETLRQIAADFPRLKIVMEHCTTAEAIRCVAALGDNVGATITVHHLFLTLNDVIGGKIEPHHFCKPVAKRPEDRQALIDAAMGGNPKFFLGTDSAPHRKDTKECAFGCAGVWTAPVAMPLLAEIFEKHDAMGKLESFCSAYGAEFYGLPRNEGKLTLVRKPWTVPGEILGIVPFRAGSEIAWRVER